MPREQGSKGGWRRENGGGRMEGEDTIASV